jgi:glucans biosynthesis protein
MRADLIRLILLAAIWLAAHPAFAFSLDDVSAKARWLAGQPYAAPQSNLPDVFSRMQFADFVKIQPRSDRFQWHGEGTPFRLGFYHQGMQFNTPVRIHEIAFDGSVREIRYDPGRFDFGDLHFDRGATRSLGYAGFRVLYPINREDKHDEIASFLGASYFRVIGKGQVYGLSNRGLALDTAQPGDEEFPRFSEYWIARPRPHERQLVIYALLDSPRATGAYQFILQPGADTVMDVQARVFLRGKVREEVRTLGVAPLTSMFLYGPNPQTAVARSFRPAIHDSNGLAIHTGNGEWLWRPLNNPPRLSESAFEVTNPKGFGLLQRGREFWRYEDLKDRYDLRPSAWIEPQGEWGKGSVRLVEIPTADETNDNIVAFWTPAEPARKGQALQWAYRVRWTRDEPSIFERPLGWVRQTFHTSGERLQSNLIREADGSTAFLIDFEGPALVSDDAVPIAQVSVDGNAQLLESSVQRNPAIGGWRLALRIQVRNPALPVELRAALARGQEALTEVWSYQLPGQR